MRCLFCGHVYQPSLLITPFSRTHHTHLMSLMPGHRFCASLTAISFVNPSARAA